jgi:hypothetical protein
MTDVHRFISFLSALGNKAQAAAQMAEIQPPHFYASH